MRAVRVALGMVVTMAMLAITTSAARAEPDEPQPPAATETPATDARAREHFDRGSRHYNLGEYDPAIAEFKAAYLIEPRLMFLWSIAQAQRLKGDYPAAIRSYEAFLRSGPSKGGAARARDQIAVCKAALASAPVAPASAAGAGPPPAPPPAPPASLGPPPPAAPPELRWWRDAAGNGLWWTGVAAGAAGAALLIDGNHRMSDAATRDTYGSYRDARDSARTLQQAGGVVLAAGAGLACAGLIRFLYVRASPTAGPEHAPAAAPPPATTLAPAMTATAGARGPGLTLTIGGGF